MAVHESRSSPPSGPGGEGGERALDSEQREALLDALSQGLAEALPGVDVLDRGLVLDDGIVADLAGVDPAGRLVVVQLADPDADRAALALLDLYAWVGANASVLARHLECPALREGRPPRLLVVLTETLERLRTRLTPLGPNGVELFGLRTIQSQVGERVYLTPLLPVGSASRRGGSPGERFVGALPIDLRGLARHAVERISRLDDELETLGDEDAVAWRFRGESLVRLERDGDHLHATLGPEHEPHSLHGEADVEQLLEGALTRLVPLFSRPGRNGSGPRESVGAGARAFPVLDEPLLTREEIDAFRE